MAAVALAISVTSFTAHLAFPIGSEQFHVPALLAALLAGGFFDGGAAEDRFAGGWHWEAAAFPLAEGVLAACVSLWAIGFFRRRVNHLSPPARLMARSRSAPSWSTLR